jgi:DNA-directed RNA polymerase specialized sigma24 family protein
MADEVSRTILKIVAQCGWKNLRGRKWRLLVMVMGERVFKFFKIKEAAKVLGCSRRTVERLLVEGWLVAPVGRPNSRESGRISEKSVFQLMIIDCLSHFPTKTLKEFKNDRKHFSRLLRQIKNPKCLSTIEEAGSTPVDGSSKLLPKVNEPHRCVNHDFAAEHQFSFGWIARQLVKGDPALRDDLVQEMSLAVLEHHESESCEYLLKLAENRALNFLRYEAQRGRMSLNEAQQESPAVEAKLENLKSLIETLVTRGVPREWIDEVLGGHEEHHPCPHWLGREKTAAEPVAPGGTREEGNRSTRRQNETENGLADAG